MHRLPAGLFPDSPRGERVRFTLDGRSLEGYTHESLAAAILAAGNTALSRSLRFHRPRAVFCATGECGWCAMEVDGVPSTPACTVPCRDSLVARSENAWPSARRDVLAPLDLLSPLLPYSFFHRRLLRPRSLRQLYLRLLRRFTGLGRLGESPRSVAGLRTTGGPTRTRVVAETEVGVVGGGLAGLSAAVAAGECGARVILLDDRATLGGGWLDRPDGWEHVRDLRRRLEELPTVACWPRALCVGLYPPRTLGVVTPDRLVALRVHQVVLAPGALDTVPLFVDNDLPGVISARLVARLLVREGLAPGTRAVVWGTPTLGDRVSSLMARAGIETVRRLGDGEAIVAARGRGRVEGAVVRQPDGSTRTVACDLIVIAALEPRHEILTQAGAEVQWDAAFGPIPVRDRFLATTLPGVFLAGEAAGPADAARCLAEGRLAGLAAARAAGRGIGSEIALLAPQLARLPPEPAVVFPTRSAGGAGHVCFCEDVREREIRAEMARGYRAPELVKRRTGVLTGPCQGKFCLPNVLRVIGPGFAAPTSRPPAKPVRLGELAVTEHG